MLFGQTLSFLKDNRFLHRKRLWQTYMWMLPIGSRTSLKGKVSKCPKIVILSWSRTIRASNAKPPIVRDHTGNMFCIPSRHKCWWVSDIRFIRLRTFPIHSWLLRIVCTKEIWIEGYISNIITWYESFPFLCECVDCNHWFFKILNQLMYF